MSQRSGSDAFAASHAAVVGRYRYCPDTDQWWWSDHMFRIHGFEPGEVVPSTELVMRHIHPDDRAAAWESREAVVDRQEPFSFLHRIVTAAGSERIVVAAGHLEDTGEGTSVVHGHLVDLTEVRRDAVAAALDPAVVDFAQHRAVIEQAKGVLMQLYSVDADTSFALLQAFSMDANMKVRDVATLLVAAATRNVTPTKGRAPSAQHLLRALNLSPDGERQEPGRA